MLSSIYPTGGISMCKKTNEEELTSKLLNGEVTPAQYAEQVFQDDGAGFSFQNMLYRYDSPKMITNEKKQHKIPT
jgi:hypothetical protein